MPKVSDAYRQARRDEIVAATIRVLGRRGLRALTMADIIEESGLSAGSVYSHFKTQHEIIELAAGRVISERALRLNANPLERPLSPLEIVYWWLSGLEREAGSPSAALQLWGEAGSDPGIRAVIEVKMATIEGAFALAAERWLASSGGDPTAARDLARGMLTVCQGYMVRVAVLGPQDLEAYIAAIGMLSASTDERGPDTGR